MKNTITVLIVLFLGLSAFAQENATGYGQLYSYLQAEKNNHGLLLSKNNAPIDGKRFTKLYNQQHPAAKKTKHITFMDGPVVFSSTPAEVSGGPDIRALRPATLPKNTSPALEALGFAAGFAAGFVAPSLGVKNYIPIEPTAVQAYLQSTYRQHQ